MLLVKSYGLKKQMLPPYQLILNNLNFRIFQLHQAGQELDFRIHLLATYTDLYTTYTYTNQQRKYFFQVQQKNILKHFIVYV